PVLPLALACLATLGACRSLPAATAPAAPAGTVQVEVPVVSHPGGESAAWWFRNGAAQAAARGAMGARTKNLILFVGDGMSLPTVAAARILDGQRKGGPGEGNLLAWEAFPATAFSRTYNTDAQTPDSAGTMSAMATGVKTFMGSIAVGPVTRSDDCAGSLQNQNLTWLESAQSAGMSTRI